MEHLDRGGLIYPSNLLYEVMQVTYNIFNICVASDLESKFINVHNQRQTFIDTIEQYITSKDDFIGLYHTRNNQNLSNSIVQSSDVLLQCVLLNKYSNNMLDTSSSKKQSNKEAAKLN